MINIYAIQTGIKSLNFQVLMSSSITLKNPKKENNKVYLCRHSNKVYSNKELMDRR